MNRNLSWGSLALATLVLGCVASAGPRAFDGKAGYAHREGRDRGRSDKTSVWRDRAVLITHDSPGAPLLLASLEKDWSVRSGARQVTLVSREDLAGTLSKGFWHRVVFFGQAGPALQPVTQTLMAYAEAHPQARVELYLWPEPSESPGSAMLTPVAGVYWRRGQTIAIAAPAYDPARMTDVLEPGTAAALIRPATSSAQRDQGETKSFGGTVSDRLLPDAGFETYFAPRVVMPPLNLNVQRLGVPGDLDRATVVRVLSALKPGSTPARGQGGPDPACLRDCLDRYREALWDCEDQLESALSYCQELYGPDPNDPVGDPKTLAECERAATMLFWMCRLNAIFRYNLCIRRCGYFPPHPRPESGRPSSPQSPAPPR